MQKIQKNGSILIWSIFLSLVLSISFVSIATKINKNINSNKEYINNINTENFIKNKIKSGDYTDADFIENNESIIFSQNKNYTLSLKVNDNVEIKFEELSNLDINILSGGPVLYTTTGVLTSSGIIATSTGFTSFSGSIILENIGGYTKFNIISDKNITPPEINYSITKTIGNKSVIKTTGKISP